MADESAQAPPRRRRADNRPTLQGLAIRLGVVERLVEGEIADGKGIQERLLAVELGQKQMGGELHDFIRDNTTTMAHQTTILEGLDQGLDRTANDVMQARAQATAFNAILAQQQTIIDEWRTERAEEKEAVRLAEKVAKDDRADTARRTSEMLKAILALVAGAILALVGILASLIATGTQRGTIQGFTIVIVGLVAAYVVLKWFSTRRP